MAGPFEQTTDIVLDGSLGATALSSPIWLQWLETYLGAFMLVGGATLIVVRFLIIIRHELKRRRKKK